MKKAKVAPNSGKNIDALLFDLGGVVIDVDFNRAFHCWAGHARAHAETLALRFEIDDAYIRHECGEIDENEYYQSLRRSLEIELSDEHFAEGWNSVHVGEMQGIRPLLKHTAASRPLFAFSNTNFSHMRVLERRFGDLFDHFQSVVTSCELGYRKPDKWSYQFAADLIGIEIGRILFFDDLEENVEGARAVGMQAVHVRSIADVEAAILALP